MSNYSKAAELYAAGKPFGLFRHCWGRMTLIKKFSRQKDGSLVFGKYKVRPWPFDRKDEEYVEPPFTSTTHDDYIRDISGLIGSFTDYDDKTVIVRKIVGDLNVNLADPEVFASKFEKYFERFFVEFCYVFYTPETGLWFGASPELLLQKYRDSEMATQALAGTRKREDGWTAKDYREHQIVVDDIISRVKPYWPVKKDFRRNHHYGNVVHLQTHIGIVGSRRDYPKVLKAIYPTPAICGYPREKAIENIGRFERFPRQFYTGILSFSDDQYKIDYAVLRCAHVQDNKYEIFTGSGIIKDSDPEREWLETELKATPLLNFFSDTVE